MDNDWAEKFFQYSRAELGRDKLTVYLDKSGYSFIGEYASSYKRQMGVSEDVEVVPFYKFYIREADRKSGDEYVPLIIDVGLTSVVNEDGKKRYMLNDSRIKRFRPIDIFSKDDFFVSTKTGKVYKKSKNKFSQISLKHVYSKIEKLHTSNILTPSGIYRRLKIFVFRTIPSLLASIAAKGLGVLYWVLKGKYNTYDVFAESLRDQPTNREEITMPQRPGKTIKFFDYDVSVWALFSYSLITLVIYVLFGNALTDLLPKDSPLGPLAVIAYAVVSIVSYDLLIPMAIDRGVKRSSKFAFDTKYKGIKFKL